jgi:hypothetical protein
MLVYLGRDFNAESCTVPELDALAVSWSFT